MKTKKATRRAGVKQKNPVIRVSLELPEGDSELTGKIDFDGELWPQLPPISRDLELETGHLSASECRKLEEKLRRWAEQLAARAKAIETIQQNCDVCHPN